MEEVPQDLRREQTPCPSAPEVAAPESSAVPLRRQAEVDWGHAARLTGKGLVLVTMGIAALSMTALSALAGALPLQDPSYCIVLNDGQGTVLELLRWNWEA